jgi:parvulin-like peptidyl-prolyl isomerase
VTERDSDGPAGHSRRALILLGAGALVGIAMAAWGVLRPVGELLPRDMVARVNERGIRSEGYQLALAMVAADRRNAMSEADRAHVLRRLIQEELLIQRGEDIGLVESDPTVRKAISAAMIQSIVAESEAIQPSGAELREFFEENPRYFASPATLHVQQLVFQPRAGEDAVVVRERAQLAGAAMDDGLSFADAGARYADVPLVEIPDAPLPAHKLAQYIGPSLEARVAELDELEVSEPIESGAAVMIFRLIGKTSAETPAYDELSDWVEGAYRRESADRALREYLARLWVEADVVLSPEAPAGVVEDD